MIVCRTLPFEFQFDNKRSVHERIHKLYSIQRSQLASRNGCVCFDCFRKSLSSVLVVFIFELPAYSTSSNVSVHFRSNPSPKDYLGGRYHKSNESRASLIRWYVCANRKANSCRGRLKISINAMGAPDLTGPLLDYEVHAPV